MTWINALLRPLFDALLYPFRSLPPIVGLVVVSLITAIGMLLVFKVTSNQKKLAEVKRRIHACLFEIRLFNDDLRAILRSQTEILRHNVTYLGLSLVPMVWLLPPLVLVIAQLQFHYGYTGLEPGAKALVKVQLVEASAARDDGENPAPGDPDLPRPELTLQVPDGLRVETPGIWVPALREMAWRIAVDRPGDYQLQVALDGESFSKRVRVSEDVVRRAPTRLERGFLNQLIYPAEPALPKASPIQSIAVTYPDAEVSLLGWESHWLVHFFILSIVFAFALRNRLGVTI